MGHTGQTGHFVILRWVADPLLLSAKEGRRVNHRVRTVAQTGKLDGGLLLHGDDSAAAQGTAAATTASAPGNPAGGGGGTTAAAAVVTTTITATSTATTITTTTTTAAAASSAAGTATPCAAPGRRGGQRLPWCAEKSKFTRAWIGLEGWTEWV